MKLFDLIDYVLEKVTKEELEALRSRYGKKKNIWDATRWIFVVIVVGCAIIFFALEKSGETVVPLVILAVISLIISWIAYINAGKANIKYELLESSTVLRGGARKNFKNLFVEKDDSQFDESVAEIISEGLLEIIDESNTVDRLKSNLKSEKFPWHARGKIIEMFKNLKKMVTVIVDEFSIQLRDEGKFRREESEEKQEGIDKRLEELKKLFEEKLITDDEYNRRKEEIIKEV